MQHGYDHFQPPLTAEPQRPGTHMQLGQLEMAFG